MAVTDVPTSNTPSCRDQLGRERADERVGVDPAGVGRPDRGVGGDVRLARGDERAIDGHQRGAVGGGGRDQVDRARARPLATPR